MTKKKPLHEQGCGSIIMAFAGGDVDITVIEAVDEAVFFCDASTPISCEVMLEGFGLADSLVTVPLDV